MTTPFLPTWLKCLLLPFFLFACSFIIAGVSAESVKKRFDLPSDTAEKSLRRFSDQSELEVLFSTDVAAGVRTNSVQGEMSPMEAIERLLEGTGLVVVRDERNGIIRVTRAHPPGTGTPERNGQSAFGAAGSDSFSSGSISGRVQNVVTGRYLQRARIAVKGTTILTFTDELGVYRLTGVPSGPVVLQAFYTDLDAEEIALSLRAGESIEQDFFLTSDARYGRAGATVKLDAFVVASNRETDAEAIATNEQRFAANIKNVIATDALGDIFGSNAGDFLKFLPGLVAEYDNAEVRAISIRGIGADMTGVAVDGAPLVTGNNSGLTRMVEIRTQALNNIARIDVTKVPTPANPADTLAGSVNMVSKRAFERSGAEFRYGINLSGNSKARQLKRTPDSFYDKYSWKIKPGYDFDYTLPIGKNFGIVLTGMQSNKFNVQNITTKTWNIGGTGTGASMSRPFFQQFLIQAAPRSTTRTVFSLKADWRITPNSVLSLGGRWGRNVGARTGGVRFTPSVGTNATPTVTGGVPFSYSETHTTGATGRGVVPLVGDTQYSHVDSRGLNLSYRFDNGDWRVESNLSYTDSESYLGPRGHGFFAAVNAQLIKPARVEFRDIGPARPGSIHVFDNSNNEIDIRRIDNYRVATATEDVRRHALSSKLGNLDLRRQFDLWNIPTALQVGGLYRGQTLDRRTQNRTWNYTGPATATADYLNRTYVNQKGPLGFHNFPVLSGARTWQAFQDNPSLFTQTPQQIVNAENARRAASQYGEETAVAFYLQGEARFFQNRLNVLTGVRFERTDIEGQGLLFDPDAVYVRNADGSFARDASGLRIRKLDAGTVGSIEEARLIREERAYQANRSYQGYYPSVHLVYHVQENFLVRLAYAKTYGRPDFAQIIPTITINRADLDPEDVTSSRGRINVSNTGLKPWMADNYDLSVEYYTDQGGLFTLGLFRKEIDNFFGTSVKVATLEDVQALGIDPSYVGWDLTTMFNSGAARISGIEFNARHSLRPLGTWGRYFTVFANATRLNLDGNPHASFRSFVPKTANWGFSFNWKRITFTPKWNYRGLNKLVAVPGSGPDAFRYIESRLIVDLSFAYRLSPRLSVTATISNALNDNLTQRIYGADTPGYARRSLNGDYGTAFSLGLRGTF